MKAKITLADSTQTSICDGEEFAGQPGKFIPLAGSGKSSLTRGMQLLQGGGRQSMAMVRPESDKLTLMFSFGVTAEFATAEEATAFRLSFPTTLPPGSFALQIEIAGNQTDYADASLNSLAIDQDGKACTLNYSFKALIAGE